MERPGWRFESGASRQSRRPRQPCKRYAASARRRSCRSSLWFFFAKLLEAWIAAQIIPGRIKAEQRRCDWWAIGAIGSGQQMLQRCYRAVLFTEAREHSRLYFLEIRAS